MACKEELEAIRIGCKEYDPSYRPRFLLIVGTKVYLLILKLKRLNLL